MAKDRPSAATQDGKGSQPKAPRQLRSVTSEAKRLGISSSWIYQEIRSDRFPHKRLGERVLLDPAEVDDFLAQSCVSVEQALGRVEEGDRRW